jgi:hypothetical protein
MLFTAAPTDSSAIPKFILSYTRRPAFYTTLSVPSQGRVTYASRRTAKNLPRIRGIGSHAGTIRRRRIVLWPLYYVHVNISHPHPVLRNHQRGTAIILSGHYFI